MVSRSELISRMLSEQGEGSSSSKHNRNWNNIRDFVLDNIREVEDKLRIIDNCIWGKLVVMERGTRIAKAYLRSADVNIDGSCQEFDGTRLGLGAFTYFSRNVRTFNLLAKLGKGIDLFVDIQGNVSLSNGTGRKIVVESQGRKFDVGIYKEKVFDLRRFKKTLNDIPTSSHYKAKEEAIMWIQIVPSNHRLESPLWLCLIHVIAVEMTSLLISRPSSSSLTSSSCSPEDPLSLPRWTAPRRPFENHYEQCIKGELDSDKDRDRDEGLYSMPETVVPCGRDDLNPSPSTSSSGSSYSHSIPSTESTRISRFTQHEKEHVVKNRGGVRKRLEKSLGPPSEKSRSLTNFSSSIIDLRTLSNMKRPVYFQQPVTSRGGSGHFFISQ